MMLLVRTCADTSMASSRARAHTCTISSRIKTREAWVGLVCCLLTCVNFVWLAVAALLPAWYLCFRFIKSNTSSHSTGHRSQHNTNVRECLRCGWLCAACVSLFELLGIAHTNSRKHRVLYSGHIHTSRPAVLLGYFYLPKEPKQHKNAGGRTRETNFTHTTHFSRTRHISHISHASLAVFPCLRVLRPGIAPKLQPCGSSVCTNFTAFGRCVHLCQAGRQAGSPSCELVPQLLAALPVRIFGIMRSPMVLMMRPLPATLCWLPAPLWLPLACYPCLLHCVGYLHHYGCTLAAHARHAALLPIEATNRANAHTLPPPCYHYHPHPRDATAATETGSSL